MRTRLLSVLILLIALPLTASITGVVINIDGQPIGGAKVSIYAPETVAARSARLFSKTPERTALATKQTDSKGAFSFDSPKGQSVVDLGIEASGFAPEAIRLLADDDAGAFALAAAPMQRGTITANGKPVAGATVVWLGNATDFLTTTDADGHYSVPDPSKWANRVIVIHADFAVLDEVTNLRTTPKVDQALSAGGAIKGRVLAENGQTPVAKASLLIDDFPLATTGDDGTFTIEHAPKNCKEVSARSGALGGLRARSSESAVTIRLAKLAKITGTVRDAKTQLPLVNAEVRLGPAMPFGGRRRGFSPVAAGAALDSVLTDSKGTFTIVAPAGQYNLSAIYPGTTISNSSISVTAGQIVNKALYGSARARVSGTVVDENKRGVGGARLVARNAARDVGPIVVGPGRFGQDAAAYSGPDGRFVLRNVIAETDVQVDATKKGFPNARSSSLRLNPGERKSGLMITIPRGVAFSGKVTDSNGRPLSGVGVEPAESTGRGGFAFVRRAMNFMARDREDEVVRTGSDGTFSLRLKEGTYDVVFKREGFAVKTLRAQTVSATSQPIEVKLEPGVEVSGRVVRNGTGIEGVMVNAMGEDGPTSTVTASDGTFTLTDLTPGAMMLNVMKQDAFIQQVRQITAPTRDLLIQIPAGGTITGRVVDKSNHAPVTSFQAGVSMSRGAGGMVIALPPMLKPFTSDDGSFTLENVPPGPTQLVVSAPGFTTAHVPGVNVEDGKTLSDIEVDLETGVKLTGRVTGPDGSPLSGVSVREAGANNGPVRIQTGMEGSATTDPNGDYAIEALDPGQKTFTFARQGYLSTDKTVTLSGHEARLDAQLSSGVALTGTVVTEAGAPVPDANVMVMSATNSGFGNTGARTDANGSFQIAGLAPGHYTLRAAKQGLGDGILRDFDISAGAPVRLVMIAGGTITGHVTGLTESELQNATVIATGQNGNASAEVDATGAYRIDGAPTGTVHVSARSARGFGPGGKTSSVQSVQVDPGSSVTADIQFKSTTIVQGRVTRNGQPMANVAVMFTPRGGPGQSSSSGTTDGSGTYTISGLDDGSYNVGVVDIDRSNAFSSTYEVHGSGRYDIDIKTVSLRGTVVDSSSGQPLSNAQIQLQSSQGGFLGSRTVLSDPSGAFFIDNIARGTYKAVAQKDGYGHDMRDVVITDTPPDDVQFKLAPTSGVTITVVDARDNRQLAANAVRIVDGSGRVVEAGGAFRFGGSPEPINLSLSPGSYTVTLAAPGYANKVVSVTSPSTVTIALTPGGTLVLHSKSSTQQRARLVDGSGAVYRNLTLDPSPMTTTVNNVAGGTYTLQLLDSSDRVTNTIPITIVDGQQAIVDV